jgi:hypothetical protein
MRIVEDYREMSSKEVINNDSVLNIHKILLKLLLTYFYKDVRILFNKLFIYRRL